jgi:hypothetical protein
MGVLYYLALVVGLFGGCWIVVGEDIARWLFGIVHVGCATAVLLLYMKESMIRQLADPQNIGPATSSRKLPS